MLTLTVTLRLVKSSTRHGARLFRHHIKGLKVVDHSRDPISCRHGADVRTNFDSKKTTAHCEASHGNA